MPSTFNPVPSTSLASPLQDSILWQQKGSGATAFWEYDSKGALSAKTIASSSSTDWQVKGYGNFGGKGNDDVVLQNSKTGQVEFWYNGDPKQSQVLVSNPGADWQVAGVGDFLGNKHDDIFLTNSKTGQSAVWYFDGQKDVAPVVGEFVNANYGGSASGWAAKAVADFNADGKADVVWQNSDGRLAVWNMSGATIAKGTVLNTPNPGANWQVVGAGQFNGKDPGILYRDSNNGHLVTWNFDKDETLTSTTEVAATSDLNWKPAASFSTATPSDPITAPRQPVSFTIDPALTANPNFTDQYRNGLISIGQTIETVFAGTTKEPVLQFTVNQDFVERLFGKLPDNISASI